MKPSALIIVIWCLFMGACASYKKNIMFKLGDKTSISSAVTAAEKNYVIQQQDILKLKVYTNDGELVIDPEYKLLNNIPAQSIGQRPDPEYLVNMQGLAKLPMVGEIKLQGFTIREAEFILQNEYAKFYTKAFVKLECTNRRVIVLGAPGGKVIPLINENVKLTEVLAMAGGIDNNASANNIRVLRDEQAFLVDFGTIEGYFKNDMIMQHGDVVYVEPIRRPASEGLRDYGPIISIITSLTTLVIVIIGL